MDEFWQGVVKGVVQSGPVALVLLGALVALYRLFKAERDEVRKLNEEQTAFFRRIVKLGNGDKDDA